MEKIRESRKTQNLTQRQLANLIGAAHNSISDWEKIIIKKYRNLDPYGIIRMALANTNPYTIDDIYALPKGQRAELIDGQIYNMAPPNRIHQKMVHQLERCIGNYIDAKHGNCEVYPAPFAVFLNEDEKNYVEPDISVICDRNKLEDDIPMCIYGDLVININSLVFTGRQDG